MAKDEIVVKPFPIYAPTLGIIGHIPSTMIDPRAFANCNNIRLKDGVASKRTGYVAYGTGDITGVPLLLFSYQQFDLTEYEILVTTTNVYYRDSGGAWASIANSLNGTVANRCSLAFIENHMVFTNGVDAPAKCLGTAWTALDDGKTIGWADYRPKIFVPYKERLLGFNDNSTGIGTMSLGSGGTNYTAEDVITVVQNGGSSGTVTVNTVDGSGVILTVTLLTAGSGYVVANGLAVTGGTGSGATINILALNPTAIRETHSVLGDFDNVNDTGAGYNDFTRGMGNEIVGAAELKDYVAVYKNLSCCLLDYIGGSSLYSLNAHIQGIGLLAPHCVANLGTSHIFLGSDWNIHEWNGGWELNHIGDSIKKLLQSELTAASKAKAKRNFCVVSQEQKEVTFFIVIGANDYPTRMWTYNFEHRSWVKGTIASISAGRSVTKAGVERVLLGLSAGTTHHYDYDALNDGVSAIDCDFETGDFVLDKEGHQRRQRRFQGVDIDVKGYSASSKLSLEYSDDGGVTWSTAVEKTLTAVYAWTNWNFLKTSRKLRFRFSDDTVGQSFDVRYYGLNQKEGEIG